VDILHFRDLVRRSLSITHSFLLLIILPMTIFIRMCRKGQEF